MGKIVYLMGKSSTGKDTIYKRLFAENCFELVRMIPYTTRPIRIRERNGEEYFFTDEEGFGALEESGKVIEHREYRTCHGLWRYFTVDDGRIDLTEKSYICIGTLESYEKMQMYYGAGRVVPIYIEIDDGIRLERALKRERSQTRPKYKEMCRRFLADEEDFCEENLMRLGIDKRFENTDMETCLAKIAEEIQNG